MKTRGYTVIFAVTGIMLIIITVFQLVEYLSFHYTSQSIRVELPYEELESDDVDEADNDIIDSEDDTTEKKIDEKLNLNTATQKQLESLDGIGEVKAKAIIEARDDLGGFISLNQLLDVKGIGDATYNKIIPHLYIE